MTTSTEFTIRYDDEVTDVIPFHTKRDERLAQTLAMRGTEEWRKRGEELMEARRLRRAATVDRKRQLRIDDWEFASWDVPDKKLAKHRDAFESMLQEVSEDSGMEPDVVAYDVMCSYLDMEVLRRTPTPKSETALAIALLRILSMDVEESLDLIERLTTFDERVGV